MLFCFVASSIAQENTLSNFSIITEKEIVAQNEELVSLTIQLKNSSSTPFEGRLELQSPEGVQLIGQVTNKISIEANSNIFLPVRLSISRIVASGSNNIIFNLIDRANTTKAQFTSTIIINPKKEVRFSAHQQNQLMQHVGDSLTVSALLSNKGNGREVITVTAAFPDMRGGKKIERKKIPLEPYQDTIVSFSKVITKELLRIEHYNVNLAALYDNGELINNVMVIVQNVSGNRSFSDPAYGYSFDSYSSNSISLSGSNLFSDNEAMQLNARGEYTLPDGKVEFNVDGYLYTHNNSRPLLTNTFIDYSRKGRGLRVGSLSENLEIYVNGRGAKTYIENKDASKYFEVGWADKSYNLLGDQFRYEGGTGYTAFARTTLKTTGEGTYEGSAIYDRSPYDNTENVIAKNELNYMLTKNIATGFEYGFGLTRPLIGQDASFKPSVALGYKLNGKFGAYNISSTNFLSSGYYPGIRRGVVQLNERVSRQIKNSSIWTAYTLYKYNPLYHDERYTRYASNLSNSTVEVGSYFNLLRYVSTSITAKYQVDEGEVGTVTDGDRERASLKSYRLTESLNWRSRNTKHMFGLMSENGFGKSPFLSDAQLQLRMSATWNYDIFTLSSYYQKGDFTILEAYRSALYNQDSYRFNTSAGVNKELYGGKLKTRLNINFNRDSYAGNNWSYSGQVDYHVSTKVSCFANAYFYNYNSNAYKSYTTNLQAGIRYNLPASGSTAVGRKGNVKLFLFYDNNANGVFDEGDIPAEGRIVNIGGVSFISRSNGTIEYRNMPYEDYSLQIPSQEWFADAPSSITVQSKRISIDIPLQKTGKVVGKLYYKYDARLSEEFVEKHGGLRIIATAKNGRTTEALTNSNGDFTIFLPVGEYEISVDANSLPKNVYTEFEPKDVEVVSDKTISVGEIELKIKQRVIEMKKFGS